MKRILILLLSVVFVFGLAACDETDSVSGDDANDNNTEETTSDDDTKTEEESDDALGIGDTVEFDEVKFTLKDVTTTDERNEFADEDPNVVIVIEYELENIGDEDYPYGADITVYDADGNQMESYPLDIDMGSLAPGKKVQGTDAHGVEATGTIEIHFAPLISFDSAAVFEVDIE